MRESKFLLVKKVNPGYNSGNYIIVEVVVHSFPKTKHYFVLQEEEEVLLFFRTHQLNLMRAVKQHNLVLTLELGKQHLEWAERQDILQVEVDLRGMERMEVVREKEVIHS